MKASAPQSYAGNSHLTDASFTKLMRVGYGAKGVLYGTLGLLSLISIFGPGTGRAMGLKDSLNWISEQPAGWILLGIVGLGLLAYSAYRFACSIGDIEHKGNDTKAIMKRIGFFASALAYLSLAVFAATNLFGESSGGDSKEQGVSFLLGSTAGRVVLWCIAAGLFGAAFNQFHRAWSGKYREKVNWSKLDADKQKWISISAKIGLAARAVVFGVIGFFLSKAILSTNPDQVGGLKEAMSFLSSQTGSAMVLAVLAFGFVAYAVYSITIAYAGRKA